MARRGTHARTTWPVAVALTCAVAGFGLVAAHGAADGSDLRPAGGDVASLVRDRAGEAEQRRDEAARLQAQVDQLSRRSEDSSTTSAPSRKAQSDLARMRAAAGLTRVVGPGLRVELDDAPRTAEPPPGETDRVLVVHQQDIQAYVNAMWAGGARAVTLQGQRLTARTGIKCVGSTVIIDGTPYPPPYRIEAVGDVSAFERAIDASPSARSYRDYVVHVGLGLRVTEEPLVSAPPYRGSSGLQHAAVLSG